MTWPAVTWPAVTWPAMTWPAMTWPAMTWAAVTWAAVTWAAVAAGCTEGVADPAGDGTSGGATDAVLPDAGARAPDMKKPPEPPLDASIPPDMGPTCVPMNNASACAGAACGRVEDGCGGSLDCGACGECDPTTEACGPVYTSIDEKVLAHGATATVLGSNLEQVSEVVLGTHPQTIVSQTPTELTFRVVDQTPVSLDVPLFLRTAAGVPGAVADTVTVIRLVINEVDADSPGQDTAEFVELFVGLPAAVDLSGYALVHINGNGEVVLDSWPLGMTDKGGYFLLGQVGSPDVMWKNATLQNGADAMALVQSRTAIESSAPADTLPNLIDALVYGTGGQVDAALVSVLLGAGAQAVQVDERLNGSSTTHSMQRCGDARLDGRAFSSVYTPTPRTPNLCATPEAELQTRLNDECAGCHDAGSESGGYAVGDPFGPANVNVPSLALPSMNYITPGDATQSYLWHKLNGSHQQEAGPGAGERMPAGGGGDPALGGPTYWSDADLYRFRLYIESLAP